MNYEEGKQVQRCRCRVGTRAHAVAYGIAFGAAGGVVDRLKLAMLSRTALFVTAAIAFIVMGGIVFGTVLGIVLGVTVGIAGGVCFTAALLQLHLYVLEGPLQFFLSRLSHRRPDRTLAFSRAGGRKHRQAGVIGRFHG